MPRYLVSGIPALVTDVAAALRDEGAEVVEVGDIADIPRVCAEAGAGAFDGYVQLAAQFAVQGDTAIGRVHYFLRDGVLARFTAVAAALPALRPDSRLTFVMGVLPPEVSTDEDVAARSALMRVLARAARADGPQGLRLTTLDASATQKEIALTALGRRGEPVDVEYLSDEAFAQWRMNLLSLVWAET